MEVMKPFKQPKSSLLSPFMFILKGMEEAVNNWMSVILVHLTTCGRNSEPAEQWAGRTAVQHHVRTVARMYRTNRINLLLFYGR